MKLRELSVNAKLDVTYDSSPYVRGFFSSFLFQPSLALQILLPIIDCAAAIPQYYYLFHLFVFIQVFKNYFLICCSKRI